MDKIKEGAKYKLDMVRSVEWRTSVFPKLLSLLSIISIVFFFLVLFSYEKRKVKVVLEDRKAFQNINISARSAVVWDMGNSKIIFAKNADEPLPLASVTKVMTALVAEELSSKTKKENVKVSSEDITTDGDSGLLANTTWDIKSLIYYSLLVSSNDGASAIASAYGSQIGSSTKQDFIKKMNTEAVRIGLTNSKFMNEHGLDKDENHVGAYGSAKDMALLFQYVLKNYPNLLEATKYSKLSFKDESGFVYNAKNTNIDADLVPSLIASKTGFTDLAGGNLVIAFDAGLNHPVIISVLGSTRDDRFSDTLTLVSATMKYIQDN